MLWSHLAPILADELAVSIGGTRVRVADNRKSVGRASAKPTATIGAIGEVESNRRDSGGISNMFKNSPDGIADSIPSGRSGRNRRHSGRNRHLSRRCRERVFGHRG